MSAICVGLILAVGIAIGGAAFAIWDTFYSGNGKP